MSSIWWDTTTGDKDVWRTEFSISAPLVGSTILDDANLWPDVRVSKFETNGRGERRFIEDHIYRGMDSRKEN